MISCNNVYVQYGDRILLDRINLVIESKDKVGLVGRNGAGKSTLLKIISGEMNPQEGSVSRSGGIRLGFLHQEIDLPRGRTVMEEALSAFDELKAMEARIEELNQEIAERTDYESEQYLGLIEEFSNLNEQYQLQGGESIEAQAEKVLKGLGFSGRDFSRLTDEFSGGWQMRVQLAKMLLQQPDFLLLDEPTNHLDIESILWLESFLADYPAAVITISHDRAFLDNTTKRTIEVELGRVYDYKASYSKFVSLREERRSKQQAAFANQQKAIAEKERTINRFMAKATKTKMAQSMQKQLDKMERIEIDSEDNAVMNLRFPPAPRSGRIVVEGREVSKSYGDLKVLKGVDIQVERGERVAFVGQNGQGKTTLARILIGDLPASKGDINIGHNVSVGYYAQDQAEALPMKSTLLETMETHAPPEMRTQLRNILGAFLFSGEDAEKKVSVLSGGERARLALACLLLRPFNLLVLDEPTNHLDMLSKDVLKNALQEYDGALIVISHDREFLAGLTDRTVEFKEHQLFNHLGDVNTFLEKRQLANMREVELQPIVGEKRETDEKSSLSKEERKKLMRTVSNVEKKIERLENELKKMEGVMADPGFYERADATAFMENYQQEKKQLEKALEAWESAQEKLELAGE